MEEPSVEEIPPIVDAQGLDLYSAAVKLCFLCRSPGKGRQPKHIRDIVEEVKSRFNKINEPVYLQFIKDHDKYTEFTRSPIWNRFTSACWGFKLQRPVSKELEEKFEEFITHSRNDPDFQDCEDQIRKLLANYLLVWTRNMKRSVSKAMLQYTEIDAELISKEIDKISEKIEAVHIEPEAS